MNNLQKLTLLAKLKEHYPNAKTELIYSSTFELLVAVMLSAQMTDKGVNKATAVLFSTANTPEKILELGEENLRTYLKSINLYKTKTKNLIGLCKILVEEHDGEVPHSREALEALPGVGRKTASVVLSIAFDEPTFAVDTHVFRVCNRTKLATAKTTLGVELKLMKIIPEASRKDAHHWLILHGRYVCKAKNPQCFSCPIQEHCLFPDKNLKPTQTQDLTESFTESLQRPIKAAAMA
jgi:endonuclease-3